MQQIDTNTTTNAFAALPSLNDLVARWKANAPREQKLETGKVIQSLIDNPAGLSKRELMEVTHGSLTERSHNFVAAYETAMNKRIQRARRRVRSHGLDIEFSRKNKLWRLVPAHLPLPVA